MTTAKRLITGGALAILLTGGAALAQTTTDDTTPGTPNTGLGGNASANVLILGTSAAVAAAGALYLSRRLMTK